MLIIVYADYTCMNYNDCAFTHKDQGLNRVTVWSQQGASSPRFQGVSEGTLSQKILKLQSPK